MPAQPKRLSIRHSDIWMVHRSAGLKKCAPGDLGGAAPSHVAFGCQTLFA